MKGLAPILSVLVAGCSDAPQMMKPSEVEAIADDVSADNDAELATRIAELEQQVTDLQRQIGGVRDLSLSVAESHESLRGTFNNNVDLRNQEKVNEMTRRGACGTEMVRLDNGGFLNRPIPCTMEDLRK